MIPLSHLSLRLRIFLFFALLGLGGIVLLSLGLFFGYRRNGDAEALGAFIFGGFLGGIAILGLVTWIWTLFDEYVARPVERLAAEMRARAHAGVGGEIDAAAAEYLGDLAPAASAVARSLSETRSALSEAVARETAKLGRENSSLSALLAEASDGIVFCGPDHRVVLYNARARDILEGTTTLSLNRPLTDTLLPGPLHQAYDRLSQPTAADGTDILVATRREAKLIEARMRLIEIGEDAKAKPGYLLALKDVGAGLAVEAERAHLLNDALDLAETAIARAPDEELSSKLSELRTRKAPTETRWWPMETLSAKDLGEALATRTERLGLPLSHDLPETMISCDGFAITRLFERIVREWAAAGGNNFSLHLSPMNRGVRLSVRADGSAFTTAMVEDWLDIPLSPARSQFSGRDVLLSHDTTVDLSDGFGIILSAAGRVAVATTKVEYDFDLLHATVPEDMAAAALRQLSFVVFDTETTGLDPARDEICQIAALRVVNGRMVRGEVFDKLVNPGRPIPSAATAVHHLTNDMVADAPGPAHVLPAFHEFASGAVLVAHNAPFDMTFLHRREVEIDRRFDHPVLDTVLLSSILFGQSADHTLDGLCQRLSITIPEEERHTAIGDARATAEALSRMIPMLEAAELTTLGEIIAEFDRHSRVIAHLN